MLPAVVGALERRPLDAEHFADEGREEPGGAALLAGEDDVSFARCSSLVRLSRNSPTRQLPSVIWAGVSANTATVTSLTSTSPSSMWNASSTRQRS